MKTLILALCVGVAFANLDIAWEAWKLKYEKTYENEVEEAMRRGIWTDTFQRVSVHNLEADQGKTTFRQAVNGFADITEEEYRSMLTPMALNAGEDKEHTHEMSSGTPATQDWRQHGAVTGVKNQEQCGSCWSFSTTGSVEGAWEISGHTLISLSEQQLVSCDKYDSGCNGGWYYNAFTYLIKNGGSISEANYPYVSGNGRVPACQSAGKPISATISNYKCTTKDSESALEDAVGNIGPVSVAIDASHNSFQNYHSGIYYEPNCSSTYLDHAVLCIGYNSDSSGQYWIVKNSWGTSWGQAGYIWMAKDRNNNCGIATKPCYPIV